MMIMAAMIVASLSYLIGGNGLASTAITSNNKSAQIVAQANLILQQIYGCVSNYPTGNNGGSFHLAYPATPTASLVSNLVCPGTSANLWTGVDGIYLPTMPGDFGAWTYTNDATSVRIATTTTNLTAWQGAMTNAAAKFGAQASISGSTLTITVTQ